MTFWVAGAIVGSAYIGSQAAGQAAGAQADAASQSAAMQKQIASEQVALQREQFNRQVELQEPWRKAGVNALAELQGASRYTPFGMDQFQADPGYAFRLSEGQKALERQAAARGGLISGSALKAASRFGQEMGSQEYMNAFNRYQAERQARLQPLQSLAGVGQTATQALGAAGQQFASGASGALGAYGAGAGEALTSGAAARASGYVGQANAITGGLGTYLNYNQSQNYLNALRSPGAGSIGGYQTPTWGVPVDASSVLA